MRDLLRLVSLFFVASFAMAGSYGAGFVTALRVRERAADNLPASTAESPASHDPSVPANFGVFWEAWRDVESSYYPEPPKSTEVTYGAIRGSLRALDDPYTLFSDPQDTAINRVSLEGEFEGIGAYVTQNESGQLVIQTPMRGQPAEKAGILAGDIVIKVNGRDISDIDINDAVLLIRGPKGTSVELTVVREGEADALVISVVRDRIEIPSVAGDRLLEAEGAPNIGYLQITEFAADTKGELEAALDRLDAAGANALIVDVRNNPGGFLSTAIEVGSEFVESGVLVIQEDSEGHQKPELARQGGHWLHRPLVLLVNKGSASASEILAGAIHDHGRGVLVGETTFGKGSVQNVHSLSDDSQLRVTVAVWKTPDGHLIHQQGIAPDVEVTLSADDRREQRDPQLERAIAEARRLVGEAS